MSDSITNTQTDIDNIALQIKSLEQRTTSVTLPRNASVMELKHEIQIVFQVECNRQRLIFQGRVLKDDKNLTDYANLDDGKVIHLVVRPADAPHNPSNDDPNTGTANRNTRGGRPFPSIPGRLPMMEGYAFITLDSTMSDLGDSNSLISSLLNGLHSGARTRPPTTEPPSNNTQQATNRSSGLSSFLRSPFALNFGQRATPGEQRPPLPSPLGFPPSVEVRLARTLASMRNVRAMLNESSTEDNTSTLGVNSTAEQLQEIRNRLRNYGGNQLTQVGTALDELADLVTETVPRMREVAQTMRDAPNEDDRDINRRVLFVSRIVQGMSLINHFMGSVLATVDIDSRRLRSGATRTMRSDTIRTMRTEAQPSRAQASTDSQVSSTSESSDKQKNEKKTDKSTKKLEEPSISSTSSSSKRHKDDDNSDHPIKKSKQSKEKGKDKTD